MTLFNNNINTKHYTVFKTKRKGMISMLAMDRIVLDIADQHVDPMTLQENIIKYISEYLYTPKQKKLILELLGELRPPAGKYFTEEWDKIENQNIENILKNAIKNKLVDDKEILNKIYEKSNSKILKNDQLEDLVLWANKQKRSRVAIEIHEFANLDYIFKEVKL